jgi:serine/threonine protein kinase
VLGTGGFGTVRQVVHRGSGSKFAMKVVDLGGIKDPTEYKFVVNEVNIMKVSVDFSELYMRNKLQLQQSTASISCNRR